MYSLFFRWFVVMVVVFDEYVWLVVVGVFVFFGFGFGIGMNCCMFCFCGL